MRVTATVTTVADMSSSTASTWVLSYVWLMTRLFTVFSLDILWMYSILSKIMFQIILDFLFYFTRVLSAQSFCAAKIYYKIKKASPWVQSSISTSLTALTTHDAVKHNEKL